MILLHALAGQMKGKKKSRLQTKPVVSLDQTNLAQLDTAAKQPKELC